jgi:hypothetical protein
MGSTVFAHDIVRMAAVADVGMPFGVRTFVDRPAVTALSSRVTPGTGGTAVLETAVDLLHRPQGRVAVRGVVAPGRPALVPGVLTHVVERLVAGEHTPESARASSVVSVGALFERAAAEGVPLVVLRRPADVDGLGYPADAAARLRTALVDGVVAVVPGRAIAIGGSPRVGWWLVDVGTGEVRDQMDDGRGVSGLEDTVPIRVITVASAPSYLKLGLCMAFAAVATAYIIFLVSTATSDSVSGGDVVAAGLGGAGTSVLGAACAIA